MSPPPPSGSAEPDGATWERLRRLAHEASRAARVPYSGFCVGAAGLLPDGSTVVGCNVESASYGVTLCAECGLVSAATLAGRGELVAVAVTDGNGHVLTPCGRCRQLLFDVAGGGVLIDHEPQPVRLDALLVDAFGHDRLKEGPR